MSQCVNENPCKGENDGACYASDLWFDRSAGWSSVVGIWIHREAAACGVAGKSGNNHWLTHGCQFFRYSFCGLESGEGCCSDGSCCWLWQGAMSMGWLGVCPQMRPITIPAVRRGSCWSAATWLGGWGLRLRSIHGAAGCHCH